MYYPQEKVPLPVGGSGPHVRLIHGSFGSQEYTTQTASRWMRSKTGPGVFFAITVSHAIWFRTMFYKPWWCDQELAGHLQHISIASNLCRHSLGKEILANFWFVVILTAFTAPIRAALRRCRWSQPRHAAHLAALARSWWCISMETCYYGHQSVLTVLRGRCACSTHFALTSDLTYDLDFQSPASCGRDHTHTKTLKSKDWLV